MVRFNTVKAAVQRQAQACGRQPARLIAVSKTADIPAIKEAALQGAVDFGENRAEELASKASALPDLTWHFIGNIQSRKIPLIVAYADYVHSLTERHHAEVIARTARDLGKVQNVLVEINVSGEISKSGLKPEDALDFLRYCLSLQELKVCGLMTMAPRADDIKAKETFCGLRQLRDSLNEVLSGTDGCDLHELSMGMSDDWKAAISCGATMVRIGRAIFDDHYREEQC